MGHKKIYIGILHIYKMGGRRRVKNKKKIIIFKKPGFYGCKVEV